MSTRGTLAALVALFALTLATLGYTAWRYSAVEQRVQQLEDTEAIRSLLIEYGRVLDRRDFDAYGRLFATDGSWTGGMGSATSPAAIGKMVEAGFAAMSPDLYENSNHVMTSFDVDIDGDTATAWSRWLWVVEGSDGRPQPERGGFYEDSLVRENGQWRFKDRRAVTELTR